MTLKFHNTLTGKIDEFVSQTPGKVLLYTCGPTVYNYLHVGNWASYIYWDTLVRILMANNYEVDRVMNITDVGHLTSDADEGEDKLEKGARREGKSAWEIAKFYTDDFIIGMNKLGLITPTHIERATDYIPEQLELIRQLKDKGLTYQIDDGIYFDTSRFPSYANFAHLNLAAQQAGARVECNINKKNPSDFALWKFTLADEKRNMEWETPIDLLDGDEAIVTSEHLQPESDQVSGPLSDPARSRSDVTIAKSPKMGFPGWHLECSAIAMKLLGKTLDIHTGGIDHIPIHHTNEIAQSEGATGAKFSNYWLHNNFLKVDGSKISKSLDNGYTLQDLEKHGFSAIDFRMFVLQGHYRSEGNFTFEGLQSAKNRLSNWRNIAAIRHQIHDTIESDRERNEDDTTVSPYATPQAVIEAVNNDLGTPEALRIIDETFSTIIVTKPNDINGHAFLQLLEVIDELLGLQLIVSTPDISDEVKQIIIERNSARYQKDWAKSDKLRDRLLKQGIVLRDLNSGAIWEYKA